MKIKFSIPLVIVLLSCSKKVSTQTTPVVVGPWEVSQVELTDAMVKFSMKNTSNNVLVVHKPMEKDVSELSASGPKAINILYCDCGYNCPAPPERLSVEPDTDFYFSWDLMAEECVSEGVSQSTSKTKVKTGSYVVKINYSLPGSREKFPVEIPFRID